MIKKITWAVSILITLVLIILLFNVIHHTRISYRPSPDRLVNNATVNQYLNNYIKKYAPDSKPIFIPTGFFIESLKFVSAHTVHISGYVWEKYTDKLLAKIKPGFIFPEAKGLTIVEAYKRKGGEYTTFGWHFETNIVENFDYSRFPLDYKTVELRILHKEFEKNIILTPDFASYSSTKPSNIFGIDSRIVLRNFQLKDTFFKYDLASYDTNFGIKNYIGQENFPELYFNITLKRRFLDAFVTNLFPLAVVLVFTFLTLLIVTTQDDSGRKFGFNLSIILQVCSLFLFIVLLSHINLRNTISEDKIIYIEHIYFALYASLIYVAVNPFLVIKGNPENKIVKFFRYQDNLIPKALFLPCVFAFLLWISEKILR